MNGIILKKININKSYFLFRLTNLTISIIKVPIRIKNIKDQYQCFIKACFKITAKTTPNKMMVAISFIIRSLMEEEVAYVFFRLEIIFQHQK